MSELDAIRIKIADTEADLAAAKTAGKDALIVVYGNILIEQQKEKNILLAGSGNYFHIGDQYRCFSWPLPCAPSPDTQLYRKDLFLNIRCH